MEGVDYAFSTPDPAGLYAAGKRFALRYVGPGTDDKHLHADERDALWAAGLSIGLLAEQADNSALGGFAEGAREAREALANARALGAPDSLPIYFAIDFDVTAAQWPACREYLRGAASVLGLGRVGIYGGIRAIQWAARDGVAAWFFQTYAWSAGVWFAGNHVEQYHNGVPLAGGEVDLCRSKQDHFGQWTHGGGDGSMLCKYGDSGPIVEALQRQIDAAGGYVPPPYDGIYDHDTANALLALLGFEHTPDGNSYGPEQYVALMVKLAQVHAGKDGKDGVDGKDGAVGPPGPGIAAGTEVKVTIAGTTVEPV